MDLEETAIALRGPVHGTNYNSWRRAVDGRPAGGPKIKTTVEFFAAGSVVKGENAEWVSTTAVSGGDFADPLGQRTVPGHDMVQGHSVSNQVQGVKGGQVMGFQTSLDGMDQFQIGVTPFIQIQLFFLKAQFLFPNESTQNIGLFLSGNLLVTQQLFPNLLEKLNFFLIHQKDIIQ